MPNRNQACLLAIFAIQAVLGQPQIANSTVPTYRFSSPNKKYEAPPQVKSLPLPEEYTFWNEDQKLCDLIYGEGYLRHIAQHQDTLCDDESTSRVQSFSPPHLPPSMHPDSDRVYKNRMPLYLIQGMAYESARNGSSPSFKAQCIEHKTANQHASLDNLRSRVPFGVGSKSVGNCSARNGGQWYLILQREGPDARNNHKNIWHKLMELWQAKLTLDVLRIAINPTTGKAWLSEDDYARLRVVVTDDRDDPWDKWYSIINGRKLERLDDLTPGTCLDNVVVSLHSWGAPFWTGLRENFYHEACAQTRLLADTFLGQIMELMGVTPRPTNSENINVHPSITIVNRVNTTRSFWDIDRLERLLRKAHPQSKVTVVDFATISLLEQVQLMQSTDVLVGHHGAALAHILFLRPGSAMVEFSMSPSRSFRSVSNMRGVMHFQEPVLTKEQYDAAVAGLPIPAADTSGIKNGEDMWVREWAYLTDEQWLGAIDAGVRSQKNRRYE